MLFALLAFQVWLNYRSAADISYSDLLLYLEKGNIAEVSITESLIEGHFKTSQNGYDYFVTRRVDPDLVKLFADKNVVVNGASDSNVLTAILSWVLPALVLGAVWYF